MVIETTPTPNLVFFYCENVAGYAKSEDAEQMAATYIANGGSVVRKNHN